MANTIPQSSVDRHAVLQDVRPKMARADVLNLDVAAADWKPLVGAALVRAVNTSGLSDKEVAALAGVDAAEYGKWKTGERRPHFDRLLRIDLLRQALVTELARLDTNVEVVTQIRWRTA